MPKLTLAELMEKVSHAVIVTDTMRGVTLTYSPTPGLGNLLISKTENGAGTDSFGNSYLNGDRIYFELIP